jgi:hypothetical protein
MSNLESQLPLLMAMGAAKRKDPAKFAKLMQDLGIDSWNHLNPAKYSGAIASCALIVGNDDKPTVDEICEALADDPSTLPVREQLQAMALDRAAPKGNGLNLDSVVNKSGTVSEALNAMGSLANGARKLGKGI